MKPTAGTASGVHPVPLGFGRVYVKVEGDFSYETWLEGLLAGRSFVTTGPMLEVDYRREGDLVTVSVVYKSSGEFGGSVDVVVNGDIVHLGPQRTGSVYAEIPLDHSSWIAIRVIEDGKPRFAHTAPVYFDLPGKPLPPKPEEVAYLIKRVEDEIKRHSGVLEEEALDEYNRALEYYRALLD